MLLGLRRRRYFSVFEGLRAPSDALTPCELVNSVIISPHPPRLRMNRRNTVSVTPAMGASTVAGAIFTGPMEKLLGNGFMTFQFSHSNRCGPALPRRRPS